MHAHLLADAATTVSIANLQGGSFSTKYFKSHFYNSFCFLFSLHTFAWACSLQFIINLFGMLVFSYISHATNSLLDFNMTCATLSLMHILQVQQFSDLSSYFNHYLVFKL